MLPPWQKPVPAKDGWEPNSHLSQRRDKGRTAASARIRGRYHCRQGSRYQEKKVLWHSLQEQKTGGNQVSTYIRDFPVSTLKGLSVEKVGLARWATMPGRSAEAAYPQETSPSYDGRPQGQARVSGLLTRSWRFPGLRRVSTRPRAPVGGVHMGPSTV